MQDIQQTILGFITQQPIFRERIMIGGYTEFDRRLIQQLRQCRDERGHVYKGISYYEKIRTEFPIHADTESIIVHHPSMEIRIVMRPFLRGEIRFRDEGCRFPESEDDDFYAYVMENYDCPIDLDDAYCKNGMVYLRWDHNHFMDMPYQIGYVLPRKTHVPMLWEYTFSGPAQVYQEALILARHFG